MNKDLNKRILAATQKTITTTKLKKAEDEQFIEVICKLIIKIWTSRGKTIRGRPRSFCWDKTKTTSILMRRRLYKHHEVENIENIEFSEMFLFSNLRPFLFFSTHILDHQDFANFLRWHFQKKKIF